MRLLAPGGVATTTGADQLSRDTSHTEKIDGQDRSQLALGQSVAQHLFDAGVVALAGRPNARDDIGGEAEADMDLWRRDRRAAHPLPGLELLGKDLLERPRPREILLGPFRVFVKIGWGLGFLVMFPDLSGIRAQADGIETLPSPRESGGPGASDVSVALDSRFRGNDG
jgi:hypothetical protein